MNMFGNRFRATVNLRAKLAENTSKYMNRSYSQLGEDVLVEFLLNQLGVNSPFYIDIGSNDPIKLSNTYLLYKKGGHGVCIEPNPVLANKHRKIRPRDTVLNVGVSVDGRTEADYFMMDWHEFNTFDQNQARKVQEKYEGKNNIKKIVSTPLMELSEIMNTFTKQEIDILSIDVEGLDHSILKLWDFQLFPAKLICVEVHDINTNSINAELVKFVMSKNYSLVATNPINYIFSKD
jgi:FkbM family methyltransferase